MSLGDNQDCLLTLFQDLRSLPVTYHSCDTLLFETRQKSNQLSARPAYLKPKLLFLPSNGPVCLMDLCDIRLSSSRYAVYEIVDGW